MLVDKDIKNKFINLFLEPDEFESEEEAKAAFFFPSTKEGKKLLKESAKAKSLTYQEFKLCVDEHLNFLRARNAKSSI